MDENQMLLRVAPHTSHREKVPFIIDYYGFEGKIYQHGGQIHKYYYKITINN